jgi:hypothetical protein
VVDDIAHLTLTIQSFFGNDGGNFVFQDLHNERQVFKLYFICQIPSRLAREQDIQCFAHPAAFTSANDRVHVVQAIG